MASSIPHPPADASTNHDGQVNTQIFEDAYRCFFESLSPKDQLLYSPCASHDDFIKAMRKLEEFANRRRQQSGSRFLDRISKLSDRLQPFFGVVNIMIQSNPENTALAWGALRFILQVWPPYSLYERTSKSIQLASSFSTFFEKLLATLERFCYEMPQYKHLQSLVPQGGQISARIKVHTGKV